MTDVMHNAPLKLLVGPGPHGGAMLRLSYAQLDQVRALFDRNGVNYWWNEVVTPISDEHSVTNLVLSNNEDPKRVQAILDAIP